MIISFVTNSGENSVAKDSKQRGREFRERQKAKAQPTSSQTRTALLKGFKRLSHLTDSSLRVINDPELTPLTEAQLRFVYKAAVKALTEDEESFPRGVAKAQIMKALGVERHPRVAYFLGITLPEMKAYEDDVIDALVDLLEEQDNPLPDARARATVCVQENRDLLYRNFTDELDGSPETAAQWLFGGNFRDHDALDMR